MVVMGGPSGVVEVGSVVEEGKEDEVVVTEGELGAWVVVEASTEETSGTELDTDSNVVEISGSRIAEEETGVSVVVEVSSVETTGTEVDTDSNAVVSGSGMADEEMISDVTTDDSVDEGLHLLPGRATAEARKRGKSDRSLAVERVGAITTGENKTSDW